MRDRRLRITAQLAALGLVIWLLVVPQLRGSARSLPLLFDLDNSWLPVAVAAELGSLAAYTFATRTMLSAAVRPAYRRIMCIDLSAIGLGHCLPDGGAAGTALCWRLLVGNGVPSGDAVFAKVTQGLASTVALHTLLFTSLLTGALTSGFTRWSIAPTALAGTTLLVIAAVVLAVRRPGFRLGADRMARRVPRFGTAIADRASRAYDSHLDERLRTATRDRRRLLSVVGWSAGNWVLDGVALWASLQIYGAHVGLEGLAAAFAIACFGTWLPITPSGLGVTEGLMIPALITFGAPHVDAVLGVLTWRAIAYWMPIPLGAAAYGALHLQRPRGVRVLAPAPADSIV
ncbi:MAG TPA: lysylphosphatidylglycerol synthase transmembrane domain-containing protein [Mycobacteriales bacterium]|jgi:hypothetical protein|nr:lysylphosphatidylglycerol synthase transmembrane domain-containing protein [Mycobacteriales bacterium]